MNHIVNSEFDKHVSNPRPYTKEELRENLIHHIYHLIRYWDNKPISSKDKLEGLGHSILSTIDGCNVAVPGSYPPISFSAYATGSSAGKYKPGKPPVR